MLARPTVVVIVLSLIGGELGAGDSLEQVRQQSRQPEAQSTDPPRSRHNHDDDCEDEGWFSALFGEVLFMAISSPWIGPHAALEPEGHTQADLPLFPYQSDLPGYLIVTSPLTPDAGHWGARFAAQYGNDFNGLHRLGGRLQVEHASRLGLDIEFNDYIEDIVGAPDSLWTGDGNLVFRFAQSEHATFYSGLGVSWLADDLGSELGFNFTYGATLFPSKPWLLDFSLDAGTLGDAGRLHLQATGGWTWKAVEIFGGYDWQRIGNADLHGPMAGFRLWF